MPQKGLINRRRYGYKEILGIRGYMRGAGDREE
jgi:hypothetical protein